MSKQRDFWSRIFTFLPTPTASDGEAIDEKRLCEEIDFQIQNGVDGICVFGSTGGNGSFTDEEMKTTTALAVKHAAGRISVVAGTGARTTSASISLSRHAQDAGCDGIMVLPVSYWPLTPDEVRDHYERVAGAVKLPICVYNNPWTTCVDMKPDFLAQLAKLDNVSCIKESTGDLSRISAIRALLGDSVMLIAGWESTSLQAFSAGASGWRQSAPTSHRNSPRRSSGPQRANAMQSRRNSSGTSFSRFASSFAPSRTSGLLIPVSILPGGRWVLRVVPSGARTADRARLQTFLPISREPMLDRKYVRRPVPDRSQSAATTRERNHASAICNGRGGSGSRRHRSKRGAAHSDTGRLEDYSGLYADATGEGSTVATQMAVEDFGLVAGE